MKIELFFTTPTAFLGAFEKTQNFHFIEGHIADTDKAYKQYWRDLRDQGKRKYTIIDNSAYLLDKPMENKTFKRIISFYEPDCIIAPDFPYECDKTLKSTEAFVKNFGDFQVKIMGVPEGNSYHEYMKCFYRMVENPTIDVIGINMFMDWNHPDMNKLEKSTRIARYRKQILWQIEDYIIQNKKTVHLLGITTGAELKFCMDHKFKWVRSCDSSSAFHHGYKNIRYNNEGQIDAKNWEKLDFTGITKINDIQKSLIIHNVKMIRKLCNHS